MVDGIDVRRFVLASYPTGEPEVGNFRLEQDKVAKSLAPGDFLVQAEYLLIEPRLRLMMNPHYEGLGKTMPGTMIGRVVASRHLDFVEGDYAQGLLGWQTLALTDGRGHARNNPGGITKLDTTLGSPDAFASVLGLSGLTAYLALFRHGHPKPGDTMVVTTAAGAVGSLAGQIAKIAGCRVVGVTGSDAKVAFIRDELGFDGAINYRDTSRPIEESLREACPDGIDIYFDIVGGSLAESILRLLNVGGRHVRVGLTNFYNSRKDGENWSWPDNEPLFVIHKYVHEYASTLPILADMVRSGKLKYRHDVVEGFENTPEAFVGVFRGENIGKRVVHVTAT